MKLLLLIIIFGAVWAAGGCNEGGREAEADTGGQTDASTPSDLPLDSLIQQLARGNNQFALALYAKLRPAEGNLFYSPYSISSALAMTWAGAREATAAQMKQALRFPLPEADLHRSFGGLTASLNERGERGGYELTVANALWAQEGFQFEGAFLQLTRTAYDAALENMDFAGDAEAARLEINSWVEEKTRNKIKDLLPQGSVNRLTRLVLTNAIYFKGSWAEEFKPEQTFDEPFKLTADDSKDVPMMHRVGRADYMETESWQAVRLPYRQDELSMVILLPRQVDGLAGLESALTDTLLDDLSAGFRNQKVHLTIPKFKMATQFSLKPALAGLGMTDAFAPGRADFTGISGRGDLHITAVLHKAFVEVNEEGTEAAAATGVVMGVTSAGNDPPVPDFRADHPFLFFIQDNETGSILFIGRLVDPAA